MVASTDFVRVPRGAFEELLTQVRSNELSGDKAADAFAAAAAAAAGGSAEQVEAKEPEVKAEAAPPWIRELCDGEGCRIAKTEERAITVRQLERVFDFVKSHCAADGWQSTNPTAPGPLEPHTVNLYDLNKYLILAATEHRKCAYVELVASQAQRPKWFTSHWWGEPVQDFVLCIRQHSSDRKLGEDAAYWVCAYANNQWDLAGEVSEDPAESSFRKAIGLAEGTVTILDRQAVTYTRVWCAYEIFVTLVDTGLNESYKYDVYTTTGADGAAVGITDGVVEVDKHGHTSDHTMNKGEREKAFPAHLTSSALDVKVEKAQASCEHDRVHILNSICCSEVLHATPYDEHENYDSLNRLLCGRFAMAMYRQAMETGDSWELVSAALRESGLQSVVLSMDKTKSLDFKRLAGDLPTGVEKLTLSIDSTGLTPTGMEALCQSLPCEHLTDLNLQLEGNPSGDEGLKVLCAYLQKLQLAKLQLRISETQLTDAGAEALGSCLASLTKLVQLEVHFGNTGRSKELSNSVTSAGAGAVCRSVAQMKDLTSLQLRMQGMKDVGDGALQELSGALGQLERLEKLTLIPKNTGVKDDGVVALMEAVQKLKLTYFKAELNGCKQVGAKGKEALKEFEQAFEGKLVLKKP